MNKMYACLLVIFCTLIASCNDMRTAYSEVLAEEAVVADLVYTPEVHDTKVTPHINEDGDISLSVNFVNVPKKYAVVFECKHGKFIIEDEKAEPLWRRLKQNQKVIVTYREKYYEEYDENKILLSRTLVKYDFIDANPDLKPELN